MPMIKGRSSDGAEMAVLVILFFARTGYFLPGSTWFAAGMFALDLLVAMT
jgi:hypothetical protein